MTSCAVRGLTQVSAELGSIPLLHLLHSPAAPARCTRLLHPLAARACCTHPLHAPATPAVLLPLCMRTLTMCRHLRSRTHSRSQGTCTACTVAHTQHMHSDRCVYERLPWLAVLSAQALHGL